MADMNTATKAAICTGNKNSGSASVHNLKPARNRVSCFNIRRCFNSPFLKGKRKNQNDYEPKYQIDADIGHAIYFPGKEESSESSDSSKTDQFHAFSIGSGRH
jgi:hypothetical protein